MILPSSLYKLPSIPYITWKQRKHLSLKIWEATGHLKNSIRVFKRNDYIAMGFDDRTVYPGSSLKVNLVARFLEFGSRDNHRPPSRPLWRPLQVYIRKNISRYYKAYKTELKVHNKSFLFLL